MREKTDSKNESFRQPSDAGRKVGGLPAAAVREEIEHKAGLSCVKRLPSYLQLLRVLQAEGQEYVSGTVLATSIIWNPSSCEKIWRSQGLPEPRASASG